MMRSADREIRLGVWKIHILHHAASREVYGLWLLEELAEHGHRLSPGTLYPALLRMEKNGWIRRSAKVVRAKGRQSYRITPAGRRLLAELRRDVTELYEEVVLGKEPSENHERSSAKSRPPRRQHAKRSHEVTLQRGPF